MLITKLPAVEKIDFAHICKTLRKHLRYTQDEMANIFPVSKSTYILWEQGKRTPDGNFAVWLYLVYKELEKHLKEDPS